MHYTYSFRRRLERRRVNQIFKVFLYGMSNALKAVRNIVTELLYPRRCPVCDEIVRTHSVLILSSVTEQEKICPACMKKLKLLTPPWCMKCGKKLSEDHEFCVDCNRQVHYFDRGRALYEYQSAAPSIYRMKYAARREYADYFGGEMARYLGSFLRQVKPDGIVPIPLHRKRMKKRAIIRRHCLQGSWESI